MNGIKAIELIIKEMLVIVIAATLLISNSLEAQTGSGDKSAGENTPIRMRERITDCEWVSIPPGPYTYGKGNQSLSIDYEFFIMKYEVSNEQYQSYLTLALAQGRLGLVNDTTVQGYYAGDKFWNPGQREFLDLDDKDCRIHYKAGMFFVEKGYEGHPVVEVTWFGANAFATFFKYKLPSERAWEKAARGNSGNRYPWGDEEPSCREANSFGCNDGTVSANTTRGLSTYGVADMAGNVSEWTRNNFHANTYVKVVRGGAWDGMNGNLLSYRRENEDPKESTKSLGFRCIKI